MFHQFNVCYQVPLGLNMMSGPDPRPLKFKKMKAPRKQKVKSRSERERMRLDRQPERKKKREEWLNRRAKKREEEKLARAESGEPEVTKAKAKRNPKSNHGKEQIDAIILKLLGKSHKSEKVCVKGKKKKAEKKKGETQQGADQMKWKPGMKEEAGEGWQEERKLRQEAESKRSSKEKETTDSTIPKTEMTENEATSSKEEMVLEDIGSDPEADWKKSPEPMTQSSDSDAGLKSSISEAELSSDLKEENLSAKSKHKRYVKRSAKGTHPAVDSSDEEEEIKPRKAKRIVKQNNKDIKEKPYLTISSSSEDLNCKSNIKTFLSNTDVCAANPIPSMTESSNESSDEEPGVQHMELEVIGNMRGGAGLTYAEVLTEAILKSGQNLMLDQPTRGDGNCCSYAFIQQCQRAPVKLFLQGRGLTINDFMQLKQSVAQFIQANSNTQKVQNLKVNFEVSQLSIHLEGLRKRSWRQYWTDMQKDARLALGRHWSECWADDIWLQAAAWFLNMDVHIIWAGEDTQGQTFSITDGNWSPVAEGEQRPRLYLGYIVSEHYQSLLPLVEDPLPKCVERPAVDETLKETLQSVLRAVEEAKLKQDTQVSSSKTRSHSISILHMYLEL